MNIKAFFYNMTQFFDFIGPKESYDDYRKRKIAETQKKKDDEEARISNLKKIYLKNADQLNALQAICNRKVLGKDQENVFSCFYKVEDEVKRQNPDTLNKLRQNGISLTFSGKNHFSMNRELLIFAVDGNRDVFYPLSYLGLKKEEVLSGHLNSI